MKKLFLIFALTAIFLNICYAQNDSTKTINLISYLSKGETLNYAVVKTRIDSSSTKEPKTTEQKFNFKITVQDSTDSSYRIAYYRTVDLFDSPQIDGLPNDIKQKFWNLSQIKIEYETDELGTFKHILNEAELTDKINSDLKNLSELFDTQSKDEKMKKFIEDFIASINPQSFIGVYAQDVHALHYALGNSFHLQDTIQFEEEVIAPILNVPITLKGILYCAEYDEENDYFSLVEEKTVEGNFMAKVIDFIKKHENKEKPMNEEELKNMKMDIYIHNTYQYNSLFGVATYIELFKEIIVEGKNDSTKRIDTYEISLVE